MAILTILVLPRGWGIAPFSNIIFNLFSEYCSFQSLLHPLLHWFLGISFFWEATQRWKVWFFLIALSVTLLFTYRKADFFFSFKENIFTERKKKLLPKRDKGSWVGCPSLLIFGCWLCIQLLLNLLIKPTRTKPKLSSPWENVKAQQIKCRLPPYRTNCESSKAHLNTGCMHSGSLSLGPKAQR